MSNTEKIIEFPKRTRLLCSNCGAKGEMGCGCGVEYIKPAEFAARAVAANPEKSDRAIAEQIGVSAPTVSKARATVKNFTVEKRTGRDGKKRRVPKRKLKVEVARTVVQREGEDLKVYETAKKHGVSQGTMKVAVAYEEGYREGKADPEIDPATLSMTAQEKLAAAERQMRRRLDAEFSARRRNLDEEVRQLVVGRNKDYLAKLNAMEDEAAQIKRTYREFMEQQSKIFTKDQFRLIMLCVHADPSISAEKRDEATRLLLGKRFALTGEK